MLLTAFPSWMEVKFRVLGGDMSYAADVDVVMIAYEGAETATELLQLAQLVAVRQVVQQRVRMYTDTDLATLVRLERDAEALSHARLRTDLREKFTGLMMIHTVQWERGRSEGRLLGEVLETARAIEDTDMRTEALRTVAASLAQAGQSTPALEAARSIEAVSARTEALSQVAASLAQAGRAEEARCPFRKSCASMFWARQRVKSWPCSLHVMLSLLHDKDIAHARAYCAPGISAL